MANPEAESALWASHNSVSRYVVRLYDYVTPVEVESVEVDKVDVRGIVILK
jgi:hypothetical protein